MKKHGSRAAKCATGNDAAEMQRLLRGRLARLRAIVVAGNDALSFSEREMFWPAKGGAVVGAAPQAARLLKRGLRAVRELEQLFAELAVGA